MPLFSWKRAPKSRFDAPLAPDVPFHAVGDIHGRADLLPGLLERVGATAPPSARLIFVGDYVDRGDQSREVLDTLQTLQAERPGEVICLMGNHERMMLDFLDDPERLGSRWMRNGGLQTLASYRVSAIRETGDTALWIGARDAFRSALGPTEDWLRSLPLIWQSGNVAVVHAAADPALAMEQQSDHTLLWGHKDFHGTPRTDSVWVVHGHTITDDPQGVMGRIPVDTGAYATGRLTAALVQSGKVTFL